MLFAQDFKYATPMWSGGYCDMPYPIKLADGTLMASLTVSATAEGSPDQHCITLRSTDAETWTVGADIDPATYPETSWAMLWEVPEQSRVYSTSLYNKNNLRSIPYQNVTGSWPRVDIIGWPRIKYSEDKGVLPWTVAGPQGFATYPPTAIDNRNPFNQVTQPHKLLWLSGHPKKRNGHVYFGFTKMGRVESTNQFGDTEAFLFKAPVAPTDTQWTVLPTGQNGIKAALHPIINPTGSPVAEEPSFEFLDDNTIYGVFRTATGFLGEFTSTDGGNTITSGWAETTTGRNVYNPRSKAVVQALSDGRYILLHCNSAVKNFTERDVLWLRVGNRVGNRLIWGEARAIAYNSDPTLGISYPSALEFGDGNILFSATDKKNARCWKVPLAAI